jgi:hypothetical protein
VASQQCAGKVGGDGVGLAGPAGDQDRDPVVGLKDRDRLARERQGLTANPNPLAFGVVAPLGSPAVAKDKTGSPSPLSPS